MLSLPIMKLGIILIVATLCRCQTAIQKPQDFQTVIQQPANADQIDDILSRSIPGMTYPIYASVPLTTFTCDQKLPGFYADNDTRCQVFHRCDNWGRMTSHLCPNMTIFNQLTLTCDWFYNVDCFSQLQYADMVNLRLYTQEPLLGQPDDTGAVQQGGELQDAAQTALQGRGGVQPEKVNQVPQRILIMPRPVLTLSSVAVQQPELTAVPAQTEVTRVVRPGIVASPGADQAAVARRPAFVWILPTRSSAVQAPLEAKTPLAVREEKMLPDIQTAQPQPSGQVPIAQKPAYVWILPTRSSAVQAPLEAKTPLPVREEKMVPDIQAAQPQPSNQFSTVQKPAFVWVLPTVRKIATESPDVTAMPTPAATKASVLPGEQQGQVTPAPGTSQEFVFIPQPQHSGQVSTVQKPNFDRFLATTQKVVTEPPEVTTMPIPVVTQAAVSPAKQQGGLTQTSGKSPEFVFIPQSTSTFILLNQTVPQQSVQTQQGAASLATPLPVPFIVPIAETTPLPVTVPAPQADQVPARPPFLWVVPVKEQVTKTLILPQVTTPLPLDAENVAADKNVVRTGKFIGDGDQLSQKQQEDAEKASGLDEKAPLVLVVDPKNGGVQPHDAFLGRYYPGREYIHRYKPDITIEAQPALITPKLLRGEDNLEAKPTLMHQKGRVFITQTQ